VPGDRISLLGPIGNGFDSRPERKHAVLLGGGVGIPPLLFLAETLAAQNDRVATAFFGSELPFPFETRPSTLNLPNTASGATHSLSVLDDWGIAGRLASAAGLPGCYRGYVTELARDWLAGLTSAELGQCAVFACGPEAMLKAAQALAAEFSLPSNLCLEEFMACAVGGCAGCAVEVKTPEGPAMRRVCVDGPVFDGYSIYPSG
jgi:dihydroorotate dehydrogenase electron transfer subunit